MHFRRPSMARAVLAVLASMSHSLHAQETSVVLPEIRVTAAPFNEGESAQIFAPAKVLAGDELRNKLGGSLGDTLSQELGVSSSAFGAGAGRPVIRGLEGSRVKILNNGMSVSDVSAISNDHAVGVSAATARQVEILRGPAALLYGSGAIGGLVNVVNERIPTTLSPQPTGEIEVRYGSVDRAKSLALSADGAAGPIGLHVDGDIRNADDYRIPGFKTLNDPASPSGALSNSFSRQHSAGFGASYIAGWGHVGASVGTQDSFYANPTAEGSRIDLAQQRGDIAVLVKEPFAGIDSVQVKLGYTDYRHSELNLSNVPQVNFSNRAVETRWELAHKPIAGWRGILGVQTEDDTFSALNADGSGQSTVPVTRSRSAAGFLVEERSFGALDINAGLRLQSVNRRPQGARERSFDLASYSVGGLWNIVPGYGFGSTLSIAQRAPATEELYTNGPHDATGTFDRGNSDFARETSQNIEFSFQKTEGLIRWKANLFQNRVKNFIYGRLTGITLDEAGDPGTELRERIFSQADATIRGAEAELSYNLQGTGVSWRGFADMSRGTLDGGGNLPLQPASRFGLEAAYRQGAWQAGGSVVRAQSQDRLAAFEGSVTPAYTQLDANLSWSRKAGPAQVTWFVLARNLTNQEIRLATSVLKNEAPLPGRNLILGMRTRF